jgi:hypothetical protein
VRHNTARIAVGFAYNGFDVVLRFFQVFPHLEPEMEMTQVEFFHPVWFF